MRCLPCAMSMSNNRVGSSVFTNSGVRVLFTSDTGANAVTISDTGERTALSTPSFQRVCIESESLPTGIEIPNAGHNSIPTALTVSYSLASSPATPHAAIQLAEILIWLIASIGAAAILVIASAIAMRPDAGASSTASGVRSPIAIASPSVPT